MREDRFQVYFIGKKKKRGPKMMHKERKEQRHPKRDGELHRKVDDLILDIIEVIGRLTYR